MLDFPITRRNVSVLCQSECAFLHKTVNTVALKQMYRVVPRTKRRNLQTHSVFVFSFSLDTGVSLIIN